MKRNGGCPESRDPPGRVDRRHRGLLEAKSEATRRSRQTHLKLKKEVDQCGNPK
jgi:hypothetical protein